jgi:hypothetical protein
VNINCAIFFTFWLFGSVKSQADDSLKANFADDSAMETPVVQGILIL